tara:strand:- start:2558 stop:2986 length:429 start_codon:yes stop_codon:yes gene_type:complete
VGINNIKHKKMTNDFLLPCVKGKQFTDRKTILINRRQTSLETYDDCLNVSKRLNVANKTHDEMATIIDKMRKKKIECQKTRPIKVLETAPDNQNIENKNICQAFTLSGKKCSFKAVCGKYCKKHRIDDQVLGTKPELNISIL